MIIKKIRRYSQIFKKILRPNGPKLAYIGGVHGTRNLGDEALRLAAEKIFSESCLIDYPRKVKSAPFISRISPVKHAVLAGGTLINQREIWLDVVRAYLSYIPNFFVFGTGVGNPAFWKDRRNEWAPLLKKFHYIGVRGPLSAQLLNEAGLSNIEVIGDPALVFAEQNLQKSNKQNTILGLNIGWDRVNQWGSKEEIEFQMIRLARQAQRAGWKVKWFVVCPIDLDITRNIARLSSTSQDILEIYSDPYEFIRNVKTCSVFAGTRLHSVILAVCGYIPSIMLEYRPKCRDFMMSIEQQNLVVRSDSFIGENVWDIIIDIFSNHNDYSLKLFKSVQALRKNQNEKAREIQNWINNN